MHIKVPNVGEREKVPVGALLVVGAGVVVGVGARETTCVGALDIDGTLEGAIDLEGAGVGGGEGARVGAVVFVA